MGKPLPRDTGPCESAQGIPKSDARQKLCVRAGRVRGARTLFLALPFAGCVSLGNAANLSELCFGLQNCDNKYPQGRVGG